MAWVATTIGRRVGITATGGRWKGSPSHPRREGAEKVLDGAVPPSQQAVGPKEAITGAPRIIDGDTIEVAGVRIRLFGIDAPEMAQACEWPNKTIPCGEMAKAALLDLTAGSDVSCDPIEKDRYGRIVAVCTTDDGYDISQNMVYTGWALAYRKYSKRYVPIEDDARATKRGLWKGKFQKPWDWRKDQRK